MHLILLYCTQDLLYLLYVHMYVHTYIWICASYPQNSNDWPWITMEFGGLFVIVKYLIHFAQCAPWCLAYTDHLSHCPSPSIPIWSTHLKDVVLLASFSWWQLVTMECGVVQPYRKLVYDMVHFWGIIYVGFHFPVLQILWVMCSLCVCRLSLLKIWPFLKVVSVIHGIPLSTYGYIVNFFVLLWSAQVLLQ